MHIEKVDQVQGRTVQATFALESPNNRVIGERHRHLHSTGRPDTIIDCQFSIVASHRSHSRWAIPRRVPLPYQAGVGAECAELKIDIINSNGGVGEQQIWGKPADWVDYSGSIAKKHVGIVVFDHPEIFRYPRHGTRELMVFVRRESIWASRIHE